MAVELERIRPTIVGLLKLCQHKNANWGNIGGPKRTLCDTIRQRLTCFKIQDIAFRFNQQIEVVKQAQQQEKAQALAQAQAEFLAQQEQQKSVSPAPQSRKASILGRDSRKRKPDAMEPVMPLRKRRQSIRGTEVKQPDSVEEDHGRKRKAGQQEELEEQPAKKMQRSRSL